MIPLFPPTPSQESNLLRTWAGIRRYAKNIASRKKVQGSYLWHARRLLERLDKTIGAVYVSEHGSGIWCVRIDGPESCVESGNGRGKSEPLTACPNPRRMSLARPYL